MAAISVANVIPRAPTKPAATPRNNSGTNRNKPSAIFKKPLKQGSRLERETPPVSFSLWSPRQFILILVVWLAVQFIWPLMTMDFFVPVVR
jgi:hypothetical protein